MSSNRYRLEDPLADGRQSMTAQMVWRGVARLMRQMGFVSVGELTLASGRRADLAALGPRGQLWIIEVKSSIADFRADHKWPDYRDYCDRFFFASHADVPTEIFPDEAGLILADGFFAEILREAPDHPLPAARRKAMTLRFAQAAALRLHDALDPDARSAADPSAFY